MPAKRPKLSAKSTKTEGEAAESIVVFYGCGAYKSWFARLGTHLRLRPFALMSKAMRCFAKEVGFEPPPARVISALKGHKPFKMSPRQIESARKLLCEGKSRDVVAKKFNVSVPTLWRSVPGSTVTHSLSRDREPGTYRGRKRVMTESQIQEAKEALIRGEARVDVGRRLGVSLGSLYRWVPRAEVDPDYAISDRSE